MNGKVVLRSSKQEYFFEEGCHILETGNVDEDAAVSVVRARVEPGVTTRWHRLRGTVERYYIISGHGRVEIADDAPADVSAGDYALIPGMTPQRTTNTRNTDLVFLAICNPRFDPASYEDIDE